MFKAKQRRVKRKNISKVKGDLPMNITPQYYERIYIYKFGRIYNILELYYQAKLDQL